MLGIKTKDPQSKKPYSIDFTDYLAEIAGDYLISAMWTVPEGLVMEGEGFNPTTATVWISSATVGKTYTIGCHFVTSAGIEDDRSFQLSIQAQ